MINIHIQILHTEHLVSDMCQLSYVNKEYLHKLKCTHELTTITKLKGPPTLRNDGQLVTIIVGYSLYTTYMLSIEFVSISYNVYYIYIYNMNIIYI